MRLNFFTHVRISFPCYAIDFEEPTRPQGTNGVEIHYGPSRDFLVSTSIGRQRYIKGFADHAFRHARTQVEGSMAIESAAFSAGRAW